MHVLTYKVSFRSLHSGPAIHENVFSPLFGTSDANPAPTYTEAIYLKLDLMEVVKREGTELTPQQVQLLQLLTSNEAAFQGCRGDYTGGTVGVILKPDAKPHRARPYPVPLKNQEILEGEFWRQCSIGAMRHLTPEEFEVREWVFPAFGIPKKNGSICLVIGFCRLNANLVRREYSLLTMEEILTSVRGFSYATSLDLNIGYLSIQVNEATREILTIVMPFRAYASH